MVVPAVAALGLLLGCETVTPSPRPRPAVVTGAAAPTLPTDRPATADEAVAGEPAAVRLANIQGAILLYYALNKRLPNSLQELQNTAYTDDKLNLISPASNQPYHYIPGGLSALGKNKRIIVCDPIASARGTRWCMLMPQTPPGAAMSLEVVEVPEKLFEAYVPFP